MQAEYLKQQENEEEAAARDAKAEADNETK